MAISDDRTHLTPAELSARWGGISTDQIIELIHRNELEAFNASVRACGRRPLYLISLESVKHFELRRSCTKAPAARKRRADGVKGWLSE